MTATGVSLLKFVGTVSLGLLTVRALPLLGLGYQVISYQALRNILALVRVSEPKTLIPLQTCLKDNVVADFQLLLQCFGPLSHSIHVIASQAQLANIHL